MIYESMVNLEIDWKKVGRLKVDNKDGNIGLSSGNVMLPLEVSATIASVWNELPELFAEVRMLAEDHERMSAFLRAIQQISVDAMRCTSRMMRIDDWRMALPEGMQRGITEQDIAELERKLETVTPDGKG